MRAVLVATGYCEEMEPLLRYRPAPLLNIADKPVIFYIIEALVQKQIRCLDLILSHLPAAIEEKLGDGKRWGIQITYHLAREPHLPFPPLLPCLDTWDASPIVFGQGDCLPLFKGNFSPLPQLFYHPPNTWTGWAILSVDILKTMHKNTTLEEIPSLLTQYPKVTVDPFLSTRSFQDLQASNFIVLQEASRLPLLPITTHMAAPGIWLSRNVSLHPNAKLIPPVFIGENCQIGNGSELGPDAVVENHCLVSSGSKIENSILCQNSYVGENLEIADSIVDRNLLINLSYATSLHVRDDFILSELSSFHFMQYPLNLIARFFALILFLLFLPIFLYLLITCQLKKSPMLNLPAPDDPAQWTTFTWLSFRSKDSNPLNRIQNYFKRLPLLINVIRGEVHFIGAIPRGIKDVKKLPTDWQKLYLKSKVGLITLTDLAHNPFLTEDDLYAAETFYSTQMSLGYDLTLFFRWLKNKIKIRKSYEYQK